MRHGKKFNHLSRTTPHRKAMLSNMAASLILNKRITTTVAKAKALRKFVEPLLTKAKDDTTHSRRVVFSYLNDKGSVQTLFDEVAVKIAERPGGYTRIIKTGNRLGDNADMCIIELVDYNELLLEDKPAKSKTRRSRRGKKSGSSEESAPKQENAAKDAVVADSKEEATEESDQVEATAEETTPEAPVAEETEAKTAEETTAEAPAAETSEETEAKADDTTADSAEPKEEKKKDEETDEEEKK